MHIIRKNSNKKMLGIKKTVTEMTNISDEFIRLDMAEERISELECMTVEAMKTKNQREQKLSKNRTQYPRTVEQLEKV